MSKSNKEKERLKQIKLFEEGIIPFNVSMLKLKLIVSNTVHHYSNSKITHQTNIFVEPQLKTIFKSFVADIIKDNLSMIKIYEYKIKIDILTMPVITDGKQEKHVYFQLCLHYKNKLLGEVQPHRTSYFQIYKPDELILMNKVLHGLSHNIKNMYQNISITNDFINEQRIKKTVFSNKKFQNFQFYKDVNQFLKYIQKHNTVFKINKYNIIYDLSNNSFARIAISNKHKETFIERNVIPPKTNLEVFKTLRTVKYITFDIDNLSEDEIFEMYELLNY